MGFGVEGGKRVWFTAHVQFIYPGVNSSSIFLQRSSDEARVKGHDNTLL